MSSESSLLSVACLAAFQKLDRLLLRGDFLPSLSACLYLLSLSLSVRSSTDSAHVQDGAVIAPEKPCPSHLEDRPDNAHYYYLDFDALLQIEGPALSSCKFSIFFFSLLSLRANSCWRLCQVGLTIISLSFSPPFFPPFVWGNGCSSSAS